MAKRAIRLDGRTRSNSPKSMPKDRKNPQGGLTAKGREYFAKKEGAHLKPGVSGAADTQEKLRRKGSFLTRMFTHPRGPMVDKKGRPTRLALSAHAWGEPVPKTLAAARKLAAKGRRLLKRYESAKSHSRGRSATARATAPARAFSRMLNPCRAGQHA